MSRIIQTGDTAAKRRHFHVRSCAEVLRLMADRSGLDEETRDMAAFMALSLRGVHETIEGSAEAWDDKNYWKKAEALRHEWRWTLAAAEEIESRLKANDWYELSHYLVTLIPRFAGVKVSAITRDPDNWCGAYRALMKASLSAAP
jgi:hypothetical protein